jgi:hypothetical protein
MPTSSPLSALARQWPVVALVFGSALGAMYCAAQWALASALVAANAGAPGHWRSVVTSYLAGLIACLTLFAGSCVRLRRCRSPAGRGGRGSAA